MELLIDNCTDVANVVMKFARGILMTGVLAVLLMTGCSQNPSKMDDMSAQDIASKLTYMKDEKTGLCFATVASRKTGDFDQNGFTITWVPCDPKVETQISRR